MNRSLSPWGMARCRTERLVVAVSLLFALLGAGCSNSVRVGMDQFPTEGTKRTQVTTRDGFVYDFARAYVQGDSLIGAYVSVEERVTRDGHLAYVDINRYTHLALSDIAFAEYKQFDVTGTALVGAGAALMVVFVGTLDDSIEPTSLPGGGGSGSGKPTFPDPD